MKKTVKSGAYILYKGELCHVIGTSEGKVVYMRPALATPCDKCGCITEYSVLEDSPLFQENTSAVRTLDCE